MAPWYKSVPILLLIVYMLGILILASIPESAGSQDYSSWIPYEFQNFLHLPVFGFLAVIGYSALRSRNVSRTRCFWLGILIAVGYGAIIELYQFIIPGRFPSLTDFVLDASGVLLFLLIYRNFKLSERGSHTKTATPGS